MKILITPRSFGKSNPELFEKLERAGLEIIRNTTGAILSEKAISELIAPCEGVIIGVDPLNAAVLSKAPRLRAISKYGVGLDNIDLKICEERGIKVSRTTGANSDAVADYAFGLMLAVARRICLIDRRCRAKDWSKITTIDVFDKTLGIIGLGAIGRRLAKRAKGFSMRILAFDPVWDDDFAIEYGVERADPDRICSEADFISLHCSLTPETRYIINKDRIASMKKNAIVINTARGELIDGFALLEALKTNAIYGAGLDVFDHEPPVNPEWYKLDNLAMGSHCSSSTLGATELMGSMAAENLLRDLDLPL
ncbi:MAG: phosphoglycerate dehydrogenase [Desulfovibrio sp.]|nr:phosphoglycerate dehydrogenase [Desulfovibrio sp.]